MIETIFEDIEYLIKISNFSFSVFRKDSSLYTEENSLFNGKFKEGVLFDLKINKIEYANKDFLFLIEEELTKYFISISEGVQSEAEWNKKTKEEQKRIKSDMSKGAGNILVKIKKLRSVSFETIVNIFFDSLIESMTDEDAKRELAFLKNKTKIVIDKLNQK